MECLIQLRWLGCQNIVCLVILIVINDNFNIRELEGIINKLVAVSSLPNKSICLEELDEIINFYNN